MKEAGFVHPFEDSSKLDRKEDSEDFFEALSRRARRSSASFRSVIHSIKQGALIAIVQEKVAFVFVRVQSTCTNKGSACPLVQPSMKEIQDVEFPYASWRLDLQSNLDMFFLLVLDGSIGAWELCDPKDRTIPSLSQLLTNTKGIRAELQGPSWTIFQSRT
jgi:hypothetical protein